MNICTLVDDWQSITVGLDSTFSYALDVINRGGYQLCLVCNERGQLQGIVTDSDIRKALLNGIELGTSVINVMNSAPLVVSPDLGEKQAYQLMLVNHFFHLPIVDKQGILVGLHVTTQLHTISQRDESLIIMAGGRGKRLMPLTESCPKPMLPIKGKPILQHLIEKAKNDGFHKIILSVNYLSNQISEFFGDGSQLGVSIKYLHEEFPLGTAGALSLLKAEDLKKPIIVTNGDILTDVAYSDLLSLMYNEQCDGVMAVRLQEWQNPFGVVWSNGMKLREIEEKPIYRHQVNAGIYALNTNLLSLLEKNSYCDMTDLFTRGIEMGLNLNIFPMHESWIDIGRPSDYRGAKKSYSAKN